MKKHSLTVNAALSAIKTLSSIVFPMVTFPYISRVLQVSNIGIYNYSASVVSYFALLAGLGVGTYAVREGTRYREDSVKMSEFASDVFTINVVSTVVAYLLIGGLLFCSKQLENYRVIVSILCLSICFTTIGCEWMFIIYEDFGYVTIRTILVQVVSMILLFLFVRSESDLVKYAVISVISSSGANLINAIVSRRRCRITIRFRKGITKHLGPILYLFANAVTTSIYVNSDMVLLGIISGAYFVGLYTVAAKLYSIIKGLLSAVIIVSVPKLSEYLGNGDKEKFEQTASNIFVGLLVLVSPAVVGLFSVAKNVVLLIAGEEYLQATAALQMLAVALFFCMFGWFYTSCVLIPNKQERRVLKATILAAVLNIGLNLLVMPIWNHYAAAATTLVAEMISFLVCFGYGRKFFRFRTIYRDIGGVIVGNLGIIIVCYGVNKCIQNVVLSTIMSVVLSILVYVGILVLTRNSITKQIIQRINNTLIKK